MKFFKNKDTLKTMYFELNVILIYKFVKHIKICIIQYYKFFTIYKIKCILSINFDYITQ